MEVKLRYMPEFENLEKYLNKNSGARTEVTKDIEKLVEPLKDEPKNEETVRLLLMLMDKATLRLGKQGEESRRKASRDRRKFRRSAQEILESHERTGCCDSSTLFVTMARAIDIPAMQVITYNRTEENNGSGHYYSAVNIEDEWRLVDSDVYPRENGKVKIRIMDLPKNSMRVDGDYYAWSYVDDYSNIEIDGRKIDSIENMLGIQIDEVNRIEKELEDKII